MRTCASTCLCTHACVHVCLSLPECTLHAYCILAGRQQPDRCDMMCKQSQGSPSQKPLNIICRTFGQVSLEGAVPIEGIWRTYTETLGFKTQRFQKHTCHRHLSAMPFRELQSHKGLTLPDAYYVHLFSRCNMFVRGRSFAEDTYKKYIFLIPDQTGSSAKAPSTPI